MLQASAKRLQIEGLPTHSFVWPPGPSEQSERYRLLQEGTCGSSRLTHPDEIHATGHHVLELYYRPAKEPLKYAFLAEEVIRLLGAPIVPYPLQERRARLGPAFESLELNIQRWKAVREKW